jgi:uncharacterized protein (DUF2141 family)
MKTTRVLMFLIMLTTFQVHRGSALNLGNDGSGAILVTIEGFRTASGYARVALFNREAGFPEEESAAFRAGVVPIKDGRVQVSFDDVPFADYAVSMYHDENGDKKLNRNFFGAPKEGYAVSNNVRHSMRAPRFDEARFKIDTASRAVTIKVGY